MAGVSPSTISGILSNTMVVKPATYQRIMEAVRLTDYHPNGIARSLRTKKTKTLGLLMPSITNSYMPQIARGVEDYAHSKGYHLFLCDTDRSMEKQKKYIKSMIAQNVGGIIFMHTEPELSDIQMLLDRNIPVVTTEATPSESVDEVRIDYVEVARRMVDYIASHGHRRIALLDGQLTASRCRDRFTGFAEAHQANGLAIDPALVRRGDFSPDFGYRAANELLALPNPPTCILTSDYIALGVVGAAFDRRLSIPEDVSIAAYSKSSSFVRPVLTVMDHSNFHMGELMAEAAIGRVAGVRQSKRVVMVESTLLPGKSMAPPRGSA